MVITGLGATSVDAIKNAFYNAQGSAGSSLRLQTTPVMKSFEVVETKNVGQSYGAMTSSPLVPAWALALAGLAAVGVGVYFWRRK